PVDDHLHRGEGESSPRAWGCTVTAYSEEDEGVVVPTRVGVYRRWASPAVWIHGRPHARGGVPPATMPWSVVNRSSPRAWGCTVRDDTPPTVTLVVPTRVGVYRF